MSYILTEKGHNEVLHFIRECNAKRKEILDAGLDSCDIITDPWSLDAVVENINDLAGTEEEGVYETSWLVTDNYESDTCLRLIEGIDYVEDSEANSITCLLQFGDDTYLNGIPSADLTSKDAISALDGLEEKCWKLISEYANLLNLKIVDENGNSTNDVSWDLAKEISAHILSLFEEAGININYAKEF